MDSWETNVWTPAHTTNMEMIAKKLVNARMALNVIPHQEIVNANQGGLAVIVQKEFVQTINMEKIAQNHVTVMLKIQKCATLGMDLVIVSQVSVAIIVAELVPF